MGYLGKSWRPGGVLDRSGNCGDAERGDFCLARRTGGGKTWVFLTYECN
jgi:hypothetical protein